MNVLLHDACQFGFQVLDLDNDTAVIKNRNQKYYSGALAGSDLDLLPAGAALPVGLRQLAAVSSALPAGSAFPGWQRCRWQMA